LVSLRSSSSTWRIKQCEHVRTHVTTTRTSLSRRAFSSAALTDNAPLGVDVDADDEAVVVVVLASARGVDRGDDGGLVALAGSDGGSTRGGGCASNAANPCAHARESEIAYKLHARTHLHDTTCREQ
jgi:hypothetical protein